MKDEMKGRVYFETYGCQMNFNDTELVAGILAKDQYEVTADINDADLIFINTCSIREHAEQRVFSRLANMRTLKRQKGKELVIGVMGCMAERLKKRLIEQEKLVDVVVGPDAYRDVPRLIEMAKLGEKAINTLLSLEETYEDLTPLRSEGVSAWLTVMRGCDNFCTFCVVPYTRGRERSRSIESVVSEIKAISQEGLIRDITLLGQNVNSYNDNGRPFADLLVAAASVDPAIRIRFATSHPKDFSDEVLTAIRDHHNLCNYIHIPFQAGSDSILSAMNRTYTRTEYLELIDKMKSIIPGVSLSTDVMVGFPGETDADYEDTLDIMRKVRFDTAFMFKYSPREGTKAWKFGDTVPEEVKAERLQNLIDLQERISYENNQARIGGNEEVLVEGPAPRGEGFLRGKTDTNIKCVFPGEPGMKPGDYVRVRITSGSGHTLKGEVIREELIHA